MTLQALQTRRLPDEGELVGIPFVDAVATIPIIAGFATADVPFPLPAAPIGLTQPESPLVVGALAVPGVSPIVQGDVVIGVQPMTPAALAADLVIGQAKVTVAGGPTVGTITVRIANVAAGASAAVVGAVFRFFLLR